MIAFVAWELRAPAPMLPMRFFRSRAFAATNGLSFAMYFGVFGSIFLLAQFFQTTQGYSPLQAGLRTLPWTGMPMIVAPIAGILSDRIGPRPLMAAGLALQATAIAWLSVILTPDLAYSRLIVPFMLAGAGMALVFAPSANAVLSSVQPWEAGQASGATNAIRELGGVIGVAVLASVFSAHGSYTSPQAYTAGLTAAIPIGAVVLAIGAVLALIVPKTAPAPEAQKTARRREPRSRKARSRHSLGPSANPANHSRAVADTRRSRLTPRRRAPVSTVQATAPVPGDCSSVKLARPTEQQEERDCVRCALPLGWGDSEGNSAGRRWSPEAQG